MTKITSQHESHDKINLQSVFALSNLTSKLENLIEDLTGSIKSFWKSLINHNAIESIFKNGLKISENLENIEQVYNDI